VTHLSWWKHTNVSQWTVVSDKPTAPNITVHVIILWQKICKKSSVRNHSSPHEELW